MNYRESSKILKEINKSEKILLNCHKGPDPDSIGSALALYEVLKGMGKSVDIVCPTTINYEFDFLKSIKKIKKVDFRSFHFKKYDLFIIQDTTGLDRVTGSKDVKRPEIPMIVIDHHITNEKFGDINLVVGNSSSNAEILYNLINDWGVEINSDIATALLTGILGDSGVFRFPGTTSQTLKIGAELMEKGANKNAIVSSLYFDDEFNTLKYYGEVLKAMEFDKKGKFIWSAIPHDLYKKYGKPIEARSAAAGTFAQSVRGANFGLIMVEDGDQRLSISLRSKPGYDISKLAAKFGGGGHANSSGAKVEGLDFEKAVSKVLKVARKFAKK